MVLVQFFCNFVCPTTHLTNFFSNLRLVFFVQLVRSVENWQIWRRDWSDPTDRKKLIKRWKKYFYSIFSNHRSLLIIQKRESEEEEDYNSLQFFNRSCFKKIKIKECCIIITIGWVTDSDKNIKNRNQLKRWYWVGTNSDEK